MIACVYGRGAAAFVEPAIRDLARAAKDRGVELVGISAESLTGPPQQSRSDVALAYVLPFELTATAESDRVAEASELLGSWFPAARVANSLVAHELCTDRVNLSERLLERGIAVPETLVTSSPEEARDFIRQFEHVVLRDVRVRGRSGGFVVFRDGDGTLIGEARDRRYVIELVDSGIGRSLEHGVLTQPPPFFVQRMITRVGRHGVLTPAQILRAYVIDDEITFWTEAYRDRVTRPSDLLLSPEAGAPRRFVQVVSDEAAKLARRVTKVIGAQIGAVDIVRSDTGYVVLDAVTDGRHMMIDRSFKNLPEYRDAFDLDRYIGDALVEQLR